MKKNVVIKKRVKITVPESDDMPQYKRGGEVNGHQHIYKGGHDGHRPMEVTSKHGHKPMHRA